MKANLFKLTVKEKILFVISVIFLINTITIPIGIVILLWILIRFVNKMDWGESKINVNFVN